MKPNYITNQIHHKCEKKTKKFKKGKRKMNRKEMVRLSPEGIVNFSLILSEPFRVMIINNWMMLKGRELLHTPEK